MSIEDSNFFGHGAIGQEDDDANSRKSSHRKTNRRESVFVPIQPDVSARNPHFLHHTEREKERLKRLDSQTKTPRSPRTSRSNRHSIQVPIKQDITREQNHNPPDINDGSG